MVQGSYALGVLMILECSWEWHWGSLHTPGMLLQQFCAAWEGLGSTVASLG